MKIIGLWDEAQKRYINFQIVDNVVNSRRQFIHDLFVANERKEGLLYTNADDFSLMCLCDIDPATGYVDLQEPYFLAGFERPLPGYKDDDNE